jgi:hypothetical protein
VAAQIDSRPLSPCLTAQGGTTQVVDRRATSKSAVIVV